ncbi:hypothetical protein DC915_RS02220 [Vibrio parahaemolyticus]|jgi:hypothetical protein|uniref:RiboL-PSP-HEPN domain-containing protein n=2 Tax=Vibrio harveyi group TaxID=717610 RepID=A0A9Q3YHP3_VIBPH|nr:hypothetical protein [Vibrio parahaemolyticus]ELA8176625.1 hypothetical protein [Vibrio alginolyticus]CAH1598533.1 hypothetical protein THF1C08_50153 [Vibrio jasicida]EJC7176058.1 hypothetical protein [Vibrio parahaemolyticus]EJE4724495.1 hypothetical protein [Vibrio parahaemolyticus]EJG0009791.1 hypothetical protein [Vibrio parahaemolyticus]
MTLEDQMYMLVGKTLSTCQALEGNARTHFALKQVFKKQAAETLAAGGVVQPYDENLYERITNGEDRFGNAIDNFRSLHKKKYKGDCKIALNKVTESRNMFVHKYLLNQFDVQDDGKVLFKGFETVIAELLEMKNLFNKVNNMIVTEIEAIQAR